MNPEGFSSFIGYHSQNPAQAWSQVLQPHGPGSLGDVGMLAELRKLQKGRSSSRKVKGAAGGDIKGLQTK